MQITPPLPNDKGSLSGALFHLGLVVRGVEPRSTQIGRIADLDREATRASRGRGALCPESQRASGLIEGACICRVARLSIETDAGSPGARPDQNDRDA